MLIKLELLLTTRTSDTNINAGNNRALYKTKYTVSHLKKRITSALLINGVKP